MDLLEINIQQTSRLAICIPGVWYRLLVVFFLSKILADLGYCIWTMGFLANDSHLTEFCNRIGGAEHISVSAWQIKIYYLDGYVLDHFLIALTLILSVKLWSWDMKLKLNKEGLIITLFYTDKSLLQLLDLIMTS